MPVATARNGSQSARGSTRVKGAKIVCIVVTVIFVEQLLRQLGSFHDSADGVLAEANPPADHAVAQACFSQLNDPWGFAASLKPIVGGVIDIEHITAHWDELLRLATSIRTGTTTSSAILKKLSAYPRQNGLAKALREVGRIERTLFTLDWIKNPDLRRRAHLGLNKGEARNALARAVYFCRLGEMRDRSFENQFFRASGLNLLVAAIILWNTRYLEAAYGELRDQGRAIDDTLLRHVAPLGWEHIGLTGDYVWSDADQPRPDALRPLRQRQSLPAACLGANCLGELRVKLLKYGKRLSRRAQGMSMSWSTNCPSFAVWASTPGAPLTSVLCSL